MGDMPTCFLKKVPKAEALGKLRMSAISLMLLSVEDKTLFHNGLSDGL